MVFLYLICASKKHVALRLARFIADQKRSARSVVLTPPALRDHYPVAFCNINQLQFFWEGGESHLYHERYHKLMILDILEREGHPVSLHNEEGVGSKAT
jgi:hypothetical protein